ncbi:MAG: ferritin family protein [Planctomycetes bacterium]|nr:ferritin family protein [Planctomycetota bacterium]
MSITFDSSELIEMAERIEEDGQNFYRKAAELFNNPHIQDLLIKLSKWENKHKTRFAKLREQIPNFDQQESNIDSDDDLSLYLQAMEGLDVFTAKEDTMDELTGDERMKEVLKIALRKEKDSIIYFLALKAFVSTETGKRKIDDIIEEELRHIAILNKSIKEFI